MADARYWVTSRSRAWLFAFENVCDALGIDASYARAHLLQLADRQRPTGCSTHSITPLQNGRHAGCFSLARGATGSSIAS